MSIKITIMCPHNAAKSVYAAAMLREKATELALEILVNTGGTEPDEIVLPIVQERLESLGQTISGKPNLVSSAQLSDADMIINIGCDHAEIPTEKAITDWSIPNFSDDPVVAFAALDEHVEKLLNDL